MTLAAVAKSVTPTYLCATVADSHPTHSEREHMAVPFMPFDSPPISLGISASCTAYLPCSAPVNGPGGWRSSALASTPVSVRAL